MDIQSIIKSIKRKQQNKQTLLIAIDGRSGSGKSYLAEELKKQLPNVKIVSLDVFGMYNGKISSERVINEVITPLKNNQVANYKGYEKGYENEHYSVEPGGIVVLDGIFALNSDLEFYYDYKIWVECPPEIGYERGVARDLELSGTDNSNRWLSYWMPKEEEFIKAEKPQDKADYIVDGATF